MGNKIKDKARPPLWEHRPICGGLLFFHIRPLIGPIFAGGQEG